MQETTQRRENTEPFPSKRIKTRTIPRQFKREREELEKCQSYASRNYKYIKKSMTIYTF